MNRKMVLAGGLIVSLLFYFVMTAYAITWDYNLKAALEKAKNVQKPLMVDFYTEWCGWCTKLDKETYSDSKVAKLSKEFIPVKIDGDKNADLVSKYKIMGYPAIIFLNYDGTIAERVVGFRNAKDFAKIIEQVSKKLKKPVAAKDAGSKLKNSIANKAKGHNFQLSGIIFSDSLPEAIINDIVVKEGDTIEGAKVLKISEQAVELSWQGKSIILNLE